MGRRIRILPNLNIAVFEARGARSKYLNDRGVPGVPQESIEPTVQCAVCVRLAKERWAVGTLAVIMQCGASCTSLTIPYMHVLKHSLFFLFCQRRIRKRMKR